MRTWLLGIARRTCADHLRAVVRRRRLDARLAAQAWTDVPQPDPAQRLGAADLLSRLGEERRTAFVLTQVLGLSYAEAAAVEDVAGRHHPLAGGPGPRRTGHRGGRGPRQLSAFSDSPPIRRQSPANGGNLGRTTSTKWA